MNVKIIHIILIFLFFLTGCGHEKQINEHFEKARIYKKNAKFKEACEQYRNIIFKYPENEMAGKAAKLLIRCEEEIQVEKTLNIASILIENKFQEAALFILRDLIDRNPDSFFAEEIRIKINMLTDSKSENMFEKAKNYENNGEFEKALDLYNSFIKDFPYNKDIEQVKIHITQCEQGLLDLKAKKIKEQLRSEEDRKRREKEKAEMEIHQKEIEKKRKIEDAIKALKDKTR
ncbi:MAG: tetratricopeptide repeat protein [Candidatus Firestonebacteria bacterium]|nr:tetratricopeptide repeat protein [Candidatus Firestonebacteria bacterium]